MEGVPEPPPSGSAFWRRAASPAPATSPESAVAAATTLQAAAATLEAAAALGREAGGGGVECSNGGGDLETGSVQEVPAAAVGAAAAIEAAAARTAAAGTAAAVQATAAEGQAAEVKGMSALAGAATNAGNVANGRFTGDGSRLDTGLGRVAGVGEQVDGGGAAALSQPKQSSSIRGKRFQNIWLTPWLLGCLGGRTLQPTPSEPNTIARLSLVHDLAAVSYGFGRDCTGDRAVKVVIKVPQGAEVLVAGGRTAAVAGAFGGTAAPADGGGGGVSAGCWPGVVLQPVHEFDSAFNWWRSQAQAQLWLIRLNSHMKSFIRWRLFAYEVVSAGWIAARRMMHSFGWSCPGVCNAPNASAFCKEVLLHSGCMIWRYLIRGGMH